MASILSIDHIVVWTQGRDCVDGTVVKVAMDVLVELLKCMVAPVARGCIC